MLKNPAPGKETENPKLPFQFGRNCVNEFSR